MIAIIDYEMGNLRSVGNALDRLGAEWKLTADPAEIHAASKVILPGVGNDAEAMARLRERGLLTADGAVNAVVVQGEMEAFFSSLPVLRDDLKKTFADFALERAEMEARDYPPQMRDLVVSWSVSRFIGGMTALLVLDALYADGAFRPLTEAERAAFGLLVFSDKLPGPEGARG